MPRLMAFIFLPLFFAAAAPTTAPATKPIFTTPKTKDELSAIQEKVQALIPKARDATVIIWSSVGAGSGVIVSPDGTILTAGHTIGQPNLDLIIILANGKRLPGKSLGIFATMDAGLAKITRPAGGGDYPFLPMGKSADLKTGQYILTIGHGGYANRPAFPRIGRVLFADKDLIGTDAPLVSGDSGGPLVDLDGNVVGIHSRSGIPAIANTQVPVDLYRANWDRLLKGDLWPQTAATRPVILDDSKGRWFPPDIRKDSDVSHAIFSTIAARAARSTVTVSSDAKSTILGVVVSPDGLILTKASELGDRLSCRFSDGKFLGAKIVAQSPEHDLALLKVEAKNLTPIEWAQLPEKPAELEGRWVASPGADGKIISIGIISLPPRNSPAIRNRLGIQLDDAAKITSVIPDSPAQFAGLRGNDVITAINHQTVASRDDVIDALTAAQAAPKLEVTVRREDKSLTVSATMAEQFGPRASTFSLLRGPVSRRASGFPAVLQHDGILKPGECGGPLVDLDGNALGLNIARAGRAESLAIPANVIVPLVEKLRAPQPTTAPASD